MSDLYQAMVENRLRIESVRAMMRDILPYDDCGLTREQIQTVTRPLAELAAHMSTLETQHIAILKRDAVKEIMHASCQFAESHRGYWMRNNVDTFFGEES